MNTRNCCDCGQPIDFVPFHPNVPHRGRWMHRTATIHPAAPRTPSRYVSVDDRNHDAEMDWRDRYREDS